MDNDTQGGFEEHRGYGVYYGCIVGKDNEGTWVMAVGDYQSLETRLRVYEELNYDMDITLIKISEEVMDSICNGSIDIGTGFKENFLS